MYLSNRDIRYAIQCGDLIVDPPPEDFGGGYDETSLDLHLGPVADVRVWDIERLQTEHAQRGAVPEVHLGSFNYNTFSTQYLIRPSEDDSQLVFRRGKQIVVKPQGFLLWPTKEKVGTPTKNPRLISFVNAKSTKARTGIVVHMTAPTIHAGWQGRITLEIANFGPLHFVLCEGDAIAQLTVAQISSPPELSLKKGQSQTQGQRTVTGSSSGSTAGRKKPRKK